MEVCPICDNPVKVIYKDYTVIRPVKQRYTVQNVKHIICDQCRETYFDNETTYYIGQELKRIKRADE
ncbi:MAG: hypothetical protein A4E56_00908 [Pelotomaculum sp. PtaU1.Bin065]|nr:MAG: hypothetical protein A4E56_00908 [Pelotomaculum sp. PtaU1.Bin065]